MGRESSSIVERLSFSARAGVAATLALASVALTGCSTAPPAPALPDTAWAALSAPEAAAVPAAEVPDGFDAAIRIELPASASAAAPAAEPPVYRNAIRPYLWMAAIEGNVTVRGTQADVDESFSDIWDKLDFGAMLSYEHYFDDWSLLFDSLYVKLDEDTEVGPANTEVDSEIEESYLEASAVVPLVEDRELEAILGVRGWYVRAELDVPGNEVSKSNQWLDPIVGLRWRTDLGAGWLLNLRGDVGGFDIGSASQFSWQGTALLAYALSERTSLAFGYRYLRVDRHEDDDPNGTDLAMSGALAGFEFRF